MSSYWRVASLTFVLCFTSVYVGTACETYHYQSDDCGCELPERPAPQEPQPIAESHLAGEYRPGFTESFRPLPGTLEVREDSVIVIYEQDEGTYEVVYDIVE